MKTPKLIYFRHNKNTPAFSILPKQMSFFDLTIVFKGTLEYCIDHQSITLHDGDAILIQKGALRERKATQDDTDYISFNFKFDDKIDLPIFIPNALSGEVLLLIAACDEIRQVHFSDYEEPISHLLSCLLITMKNNLKTQNSSPLVLKIICYLHENISQKITLSDIAQHTFFSPIYCDYVFKKEVGTSIINFLLEERIRLAKQLFAEGTLSLRQIAETVGFTDYNYFARIFKKRTGYTPGQYQKMVHYSYR